MDSYQKELSEIIQILKKNPKGMTVTDISLKMRTNRNSVAKYLDILLILGQVQLITFGPAKVYFPSKRIPLSSLMDYTTDCLVILDESLHINKANNNFISMLNIDKEKIINESIKNISLPPFSDNNVLTHLKQALDGHKTQKKLTITINGTTQTIRLYNIPTTFENGAPGVACIITNTSKLTAIQNELEHQKIKLDALTKVIIDPLFVIDKEFTIKQINNTLTKILKLTSEQILGKKCYKIIHGKKAPPPQCPHNTSIEPNNILQISFYEPYLKKHLNIIISPMIDENGDYQGSINLLHTNQ